MEEFWKPRFSGRGILCKQKYSLIRRAESGVMALPFFGTFQTVILYFWKDLFARVVGETPKGKGVASSVPLIPFYW
jgi:hypothetical protein